MGSDRDFGPDEQHPEIGMSYEAWRFGRALTSTKITDRGTLHLRRLQKQRLRRAPKGRFEHRRRSFLDPSAAPAHAGRATRFAASR
jgi:hypothetical protein